MNYESVVHEIAELDTAVRAEAARAVNYLLTVRNWFIGACIVEFEQNGEDRAAYGERLLPRLAGDLRRQGRKGLSETNLKMYRQLALSYPTLGIRQTLSDFFLSDGRKRTSAPGKNPPGLASRFAALEARQATNPALDWQDGRFYDQLLHQWSQFILLIRLDDPVKRAFYELECLKSRWSVRELERQIDSMLYERVGLSKDKEAVLALAKKGQLTETPAALIREPYVLEFLGLPEKAKYTESDLEEALVSHLQEFLFELGREFCFVARQMRITVGRRHNFLDLLFFHRRLKCLVAFDLKLGEFRHEHAGQMNFYLNYLKENVALDDENPPVGIILCADRDAGEVHYATAGLDQQLFVSRYLVALPTEEQLREWLKREREQLELVKGRRPERKAQREPPSSSEETSPERSPP